MGRRRKRRQPTPEELLRDTEAEIALNDAEYVRTMFRELAEGRLSNPYYPHGLGNRCFAGWPGDGWNDCSWDVECAGNAMPSTVFYCQRRR